MVTGLLRSRVRRTIVGGVIRRRCMDVRSGVTRRFRSRSRRAEKRRRLRPEQANGEQQTEDSAHAEKLTHVLPIYNRSLLSAW